MSLVRLWGVTVQRAGGEPQPVLDNLNLVIDGGELVAVTGLRGAGKSTLLAVAAGTLRPRQGEVAIAGRNLGSLQAGLLPYVRRNIGYLPAEPPLVRDETVLENVMLVLGARGVAPGAAEAQARTALGDLDIEAMAERPVAALSLPERRLCALARALAGNPPVLVLDDPVAGLDERDRTRLVTALGRARQAGAAVLLATSDIAWTIALASAGARCLQLVDGRLEGEGPSLRLVDEQGDRARTPAPVVAPAAAEAPAVMTPMTSTSERPAAVPPTAPGHLGGMGKQAAVIPLPLPARTTRGVS
jgi:ABC-type multidrug transport system ATPase subunit